MTTSGKNVLIMTVVLFINLMLWWPDPSGFLGLCVLVSMGAWLWAIGVWVAIRFRSRDYYYEDDMPPR